MLRRVRLDLNTPAELAIFKAMQEVEKAGADVRLTEATMLLAKAKDCVADFIDGVEQSIPPAEGADSSKGDFDDVLKKERKCVCGAELKHRGGISFWCDNPHCKTAYVFDADGHISEYGTVEQKGTPRQTVGGAGHHFASKEIEQPTAEGAEEIIDDAETILRSHPYLKVWIENLYDSEMKVCSIEQAIWAMERFASLHAHKIADKMVEERIILDEEMAEPVQDALYATGRFTIDECNVLTEGILMYIKERGIINLKSREK